MHFILENRFLAHQVLQFSNKSHSDLTKSATVESELRSLRRETAVPFQLRPLFLGDRHLCIIGDNLCL